MANASQYLQKDTKLGQGTHSHSPSRLYNEDRRNCREARIVMLPHANALLKEKFHAGL